MKIQVNGKIINLAMRKNIVGERCALVETAFVEIELDDKKDLDKLKHGRAIIYNDEQKEANILNDKIKKIDNIINSIGREKLLTKGYMCGVVNGLRIAKSIIEGEERELILERDEVVPEGKGEIFLTMDDGGNFQALVFENNQLDRIEKL